MKDARILRMVWKGEPENIQEWANLREYETPWEWWKTSPWIILAWKVCVPVFYLSEFYGKLGLAYNYN